MDDAAERAAALFTGRRSGGGKGRGAVHYSNCSAIAALLGLAGIARGHAPAYLPAPGTRQGRGADPRNRQAAKVSGDVLRQRRSQFPSAPWATTSAAAVTAPPPPSRIVVSATAATAATVAAASSQRRRKATGGPDLVSVIAASALVLWCAALATGGWASEATAGGLVNEATRLLLQHQASWGEDIFLLVLVTLSVYALAEMGAMQMRCPHIEARVHTSCSALATVLALYGLGMERLLRESPGLWWGILTPLLYGVSNLTMTQLMRMYKGPLAYRRLFELGQSFTLSFQGIHVLAWSSIYPELFWLVMPFWYFSLKKLVEPVEHLLGVLKGEDARNLKSKSRTGMWGTFGMELDVATLLFVATNILSALADNLFMGVYTLRGPEGFFEVSRSLGEAVAGAEIGGWGSDHLRMALVKPAVGSLVVSLAVFLGTLCARGRLPLEVGVPLSVLLSSLGPWVVFFWHRIVDASEPWLPEIMGQDHWGPGPLGAFLGF